MSERERETDVIVIGGGTGGYSTALRAAALGLEVVLAERDLVGGVCLHRGCVPSKAMLHAAELVDGIAEARERWGARVTVDGVDWAALTATRDDIVARNHRGVEGHLSRAGVRVVRGSGSLTGPRTVRVEPGGTWRARRGIVLATGSRPRTLPGLQDPGGHVVTSDDALFATSVPRSALVIGGGAIGVEYASLYRSLGAAVTVVEAAERLLPAEDADVGRQLARGLKKRGITVLTGARCEDPAPYEGGVRGTLVTARGERLPFDVERVLVAVGRAPVTEGLGLAAAGLAPDARGYLPPADWSRLETATDGVHVVGDLLPPPSLGLAHASFAEGMLVAEVLAGRSPRPIDYAAVPRVTYSSPQTASVGLTEEGARGLGYEVVTNTLPLTATAKGMVHGQGGMVKVIAERGAGPRAAAGTAAGGAPGGHGAPGAGDGAAAGPAPGPGRLPEGAGTVLGVHLVGPHVSEMIAESQLIVGWEADPADVAAHIHPHPTLSEAVGEAFLTLADRGLHQH